MKTLVSVFLLAFILSTQGTNAQVKFQKFRVGLFLDIWGDDVGQVARARRAKLEEDFRAYMLNRLLIIQEIEVVDSNATYNLTIFLYEVPEDCGCDYLYYSATFSPSSNIPYTTMHASKYFQGFGRYSRLGEIATEVVGLLDRTHIDELRMQRKYLPQEPKSRRRSLLEPGK
ncbi:MAG TPA: hypothetical protein VJN65_00185 [Bacteroidota bacterium]|nr:hypothetical protein [Bacteroidota bacterium]